MNAHTNQNLLTFLIGLDDLLIGGSAAEAQQGNRRLHGRKATFAASNNLRLISQKPLLYPSTGFTLYAIRI